MTTNLCGKCGKDKETECFCDLDLEFASEEVSEQVPMEQLDPAAQSLTEEEQKVYKKVLDKQKEMDPILNGFGSLAEKPTDEQVASWKQQFGKVYTIGLSEDEYFIFRSLRRLEWRNLLKALANQDELKKKEAVFQRAVLWPKVGPEFMASSPAGTVDTVYEVILQASNFLMPQEALACVRKL